MYNRLSFESLNKYTPGRDGILLSMLKKMFFALILIITLCLGHKTSYGADFSIDQNINFTCSANEMCAVLNNISITNNTNEMLVSEYTLNTGLKDINKVNTLDQKKRALLTKVEQINGQSVIKINFENPVLGKGNIINLTVIYETSETIKKTGKIWEISIPKINKTEETQNLKITVSVPNDFGPLMYVTPQPASKKETETAIIYSFNPDTATDGVNIAFGEYQLFNFEIYYYLKNDNKFWSQTFEVPFPPNVEDIQEVFITNLNFKPNSLKKDPEGNYIALYELNPEQTKRIEIYGLIKVFNKEINPSLGGGFEDIPKQLIEKYTKPQKYWESKDETILEIAKNLKDINKTVSENAKLAYLYTIENLIYSAEKSKRNYLERLGAKKSLQNPQDSVCMEFTDVTIALLRAMGIPAREINGYAHSEDLSKRPLSVFYDNNKDLLHSWVEFFDPKFGWVEIDPTWGQTSGLDFFSKVGVNHIIFVRKEDPNYPLPPGVYKDAGSNKKSVVITFGNDTLLTENIESIDDLVDKKHKLNLPITGLIILLSAPALYMIYLVLKGILGDPRK